MNLGYISGSQHVARGPEMPARYQKMALDLLKDF